MLPLDSADPGFQSFIRGEIRLTPGARFASCEPFRNTRIAENCIGTIYDGDRVFVLLKGKFSISGDTMILNLGMPGAPDPNAPREDLIEAGLIPEKTRFIGIFANERAGLPGAQGDPEIQVMMLPFRAAGNAGAGNTGEER